MFRSTKCVQIQFSYCSWWIVIAQRQHENMKQLITHFNRKYSHLLIPFKFNKHVNALNRSCFSNANTQEEQFCLHYSHSGSVLDYLATSRNNRWLQKMAAIVWIIWFGFSPDLIMIRNKFLDCLFFICCSSNLARSIAQISLGFCEKSNEFAPELWLKKSWDA